MGKLGDLMKGFERAMAASAFAEEGELETARRMMVEPQKAKTRSKAAGDEHVTEGDDIASPAYGK